METKYSSLKIIILTVIFGLGAGVVGQMLAAVYFLPQEIFISSEENRVKQIAIREAENKKILEAERSISPAVLEIYLQKPTSHDPQNQIYFRKNRVALGTALTSDGWLVSYGANLADPKNNFVILTADQKIFSPKKIIFDEATETVFIKIDAENLAVPKLGTKENLSLGESVLIPESKQSFKTFQIADLAYEKTNEPRDLLKSSEKFSKLILLDRNADAAEIGAPLGNLSGEITGVVSGTSPATVMPIDFWRDAFLDVLKEEKIKRPYLGVHYINLSRAPGISDAFSQGKTSGALIWSDRNSKTSGIVRNSPAAIAGLRDGDIILKINRDELSPKIDLSEIISEYSSGEKIQITFLRNGEEKMVEATLGGKL